jgi:anti-sigma B factor antagonist
MAGRQVEFHVDRVPTPAGGPALFRVSGNVDLTTIDQLRAAVGPACTGGTEVLLDLSGVGFLDSTGVGTFVWLHRQAAVGGGRLVLAAPRRHVREVLSISGVDRAIPVLGRAALAPYRSS